MKKTPEQLNRSIVFCADHFEDSQFMNVHRRNKLVWNAVPTLFAVPNPPPLITPKRPLPQRKYPQAIASITNRRNNSSDPPDATAGTGPSQLKYDAVPSVFRWTMFQDTEHDKKQAQERSEGARRRAAAKNGPDKFVDYSRQEHTAKNECEVSTEDADLCSAPALTTNLNGPRTSSVAAQTDLGPKTTLSREKLQGGDRAMQFNTGLDSYSKFGKSRMVSVSLANDKKTRKPPGSSQEGPQAGVQKAAPQQTLLVMRQGTVILQLAPGTKKFIPVTVDLPQLPAVPGSGQECRQPVLQSSGPASSESLGPQSCQSACAPYPVMLIGPREKRLLSKMYPVKARSPGEGESQSSLQVTQASQECAAIPVKVKLEKAEDSVASCQEARDVHQTPLEFEVKVKVEPVEEEEDGIKSFEKQEMDQTPQDFAVLPVEVKVEPDMDYSDSLVQVKTEPPES